MLDMWYKITAKPAVVDVLKLAKPVVQVQLKGSVFINGISRKRNSSVLVFYIIVIVRGC